MKRQYLSFYKFVIVIFMVFFYGKVNIDYCIKIISFVGEALGGVFLAEQIRQQQLASQLQKHLQVKICALFYELLYQSV